MATGNSIRIRWRLKGEKTEKERERKRRKKEKKEPHTGGERMRGGEKRMEAPPGEPRSHPRSKLSDNL